MATRILTCMSANGTLQAYGVEAASGPHLLPVAREFTGKSKLDLTTYTAKYEVISSAGTFQTPQLLMVGAYSYIIIGIADYIGHLSCPVLAPRLSCPNLILPLLLIFQG